MTIEPKSLNTSLQKHSWSWLWFVIASIALAALIFKPVLPEQWLVTLTIVAPTIWLVFVGPPSLYYWQINHRYSITGWLVLSVRLVIFFLVIKFVAPQVTLLVRAWLNG